MPTYVSLLETTAEGARDIKGMPGRFKDFRKNLEAAGGRLVAAYALMGAYDYVVIVDVPDEGAAVSLALKVAQRGTVATHTLRAIPMDEFVSLVEKL